MKTLALSLALLAVTAAAPALAGELQMATSEMNNADAASEQNKTSIAGKIAGRTAEASMAEKKQLRAVQRHQDAQESPFLIQTMTSDLQNAENVRSTN